MGFSFYQTSRVEWSKVEKLLSVNVRRCHMSRHTLKEPPSSLYHPFLEAIIDLYVLVQVRDSALVPTT